MRLQSSSKWFMWQSHPRHSGCWTRYFCTSQRSQISRFPRLTIRPLCAAPFVFVATWLAILLTGRRKTCTYSRTVALPHFHPAHRSLLANVICGVNLCGCEPWNWGWKSKYRWPDRGKMWLWILGFLGRLALLLDGMSLPGDGIWASVWCWVFQRRKREMVSWTCSFMTRYSIDRLLL